MIKSIAASIFILKSSERCGIIFGYIHAQPSAARNRRIFSFKVAGIPE